MRSCYIFALYFLSHSLFSQFAVSSRNFPSNRKNIPLEIINDHSDHFFLLRYNKDVHDLIIEKRAKPSAEIIHITPLRMDSINASWFNYQDLDHLFFERKGKLFLFFEKRLNNERSLYIKSVDSLGKAGPFVRVAVLERDRVVADIDFDYKLTAELKILIVATRYFVNGTIKKEVILYDPLGNRTEWIKKLPIESRQSGYSRSFECNKAGDLFYLVTSPQVFSYKRVYMNHRQMEIPVYYYDLVYLQAILSDGTARHMTLPVEDLWGIHTAVLYSRNDTIGVHLHYNANDSTEDLKMFFYTTQISRELDEVFSVETTKLSPLVTSQLTYFDGTDRDRPADKDFRTIRICRQDRDVYVFSGRMDATYAKEILSYRINTANSSLSAQRLIPRKIYFYDDRSRFRNLSVTSHFTFQERIYSLVLENRANRDQDPEAYVFRRFSRQRELKNGGLAIYYQSGSGELKKKYVLPDQDADFVPLRYQTGRNEYIMYQSRARTEKFVILDLGQL